MEDKNYRDEFEFFLKESADELRMVPSRKIWYSIYNNLHPDRKWPSMAVCLLILTAVLYVGIANNNSISSAAKNATSQNFATIIKENNIDKKTTLPKDDYINSTAQALPNKVIDLANVTNGVVKKQNTLNRATKENQYPLSNSITTVYRNEIPANVAFGNSTIEGNLILEVTNANNKTETSHFVASKAETKTNIAKLNDTGEMAGTDFENVNETKKTDNIFSDNKTLVVENSSLKSYLLNIEKSWKEDYAFRNKPAINKFKQNASLSYYITPSLGYRSFKRKGEKQYTGSSLVIARGNNDEALLIDDAALNLEAGAVLQYTVSKSIRLKTGLQANYTNYLSHVTALGHPSQTSLSLANRGTVVRSSSYTTKAGNDRINKTTMQVSLPIGADVKIAGKGNLKWYAGATLQPTYVISGSAFVLSADEKYYIAETPLLRKMNLNTGIETYLSFKSSNGVILSVGPQFRYQLLSTYKNDYNYSEKAYNIGVKVGITTSF